MSISYVLGEQPKWVVPQNDGTLSSGIAMYTYRSVDHSEYKAIYREATGTLTWPQGQIFNSVGEAGPFYFADDEDYFIVIKNALTHANLWQVDNYTPGAGTGPVTSVIDLTNHITNGQFTYFNARTFTNLADVDIAANYWSFHKSNANVVDELSFVDFGPGDTVPEGNPLRYLRYVSTSVGAGGETYKFIDQTYLNVRNFQNTEVTIGFQAKSIDVQNIEIISSQDFGSGGVPSPEVRTSLAVIAINSTAFEKYTATVTIPSIAGKTIGTNGDDFLRIAVQLPLNTILDMGFTNFDLKVGNLIGDYPYEDTNMIAGRLLYSWNPNSPPLGSVLSMNSVEAHPVWTNLSPIGHIIMWPVSGSIPSPYVACNGASYPTATYPLLFALIGYSQGGSGANFNVPDMRGLVPRGWDNGRGLDPGRAIGTYQADEFASHNHTSPNGQPFVTYDALTATTQSGGDYGFLNTNTTVTQPSGGSETRGKNFSVQFLIRAQ